MNKIFLISTILITYGVSGQNALLIPDTISGTTVNLTLQNGTHQFYTGINTTTMGVNGNILAPTLLLNHGDSVSFNVDNQIADTTTIHWHGLHVSPENDGGPHTAIPPGTTWNPSFVIRDKAATYWYHPHLHHKTNKHVSKGISGLILVRDNDEANLVLPKTYGLDDFPIILQTKDFDSNGEIIVPSNTDDVAMVNATIDPFLQVPAQVIRYRVLNGSSQRSFNIGLTGNQTFYQIASDGGLLSVPFQTTRLLLSPGERAEILIDFTGMSGQTVYLKSYASELSNGIYGATNPGMGAGMIMTGYTPNSLNGSDFNLLQFNVIAQTLNPITTIPANLVTVTPISVGTSNITRSLTFSPVTMGPNQLDGDFLINSTSFDMNVVNYTIPLNNTEIWELTNQSAIAHPFHIHDVQFYILTRNGVAPPVNEQGRKDVVLVKPQEIVQFIAKFDDFANSTIPYMYHCHLLPHEDGGMMGQFVVDYPASVLDSRVEVGLKVYPNPSNRIVSIVSKKEIRKITIYDQFGRIVKSLELDSSNMQLNISDLSEGIYNLIITSNQGEKVIKKLVIE